MTLPARVPCVAAKLLALALPVLVSPASARSASARTGVDPRPLPPLSTSSVPVYPSLNAFLDASRASRLAPSPQRLPERVIPVSVGVAPRVATAGAAASEVSLAGAGQGGTITRWQRAENGTLRWLEGNLGNALGVPTGGSTAGTLGSDARLGVVLPPADLPARVLSILKPYAGLMGLTDIEHELRLRNRRTDELGWQHLRFDQVHRGVPVWGRDLYVHLDPSGSVRIVNGAYDRTPAVADVAPARTSDEAAAAVRTDPRLAGRWAPVSDAARAMLRYDDEGAELVVYPTAGGHRLAWAVSVRPNLLEWWTVVVDAKTGAVLDRIQQHCDVAGFQAASGKDLGGTTRSFRTWLNDQSQSYMLWDISNYAAAQSTLPDTMAGGITTLDLRNQDVKQGVTIYHITSANNTWTDPSAVAAHYNANVAFDYFKNTHARKAIDGNDANIISIIHVTEDGEPMDNAFWNGRAMFYGDGNTAFKPLAGGLDVAGHEMSHGVIGNSAGLKYQNQSGALNESFADVFGAMVDREDYLIGEDVMKPGYGTALRNLENPADPNVLSSQPASMAQYDNTTQDNGGVHTNSGIPNRAAALIMKAIGREKTEKIYYRALTTYLTSTSQFLDCRNAIEQSTKDLYPNGTTELAAVRTAFNTVGIVAPTQPPPPPPGGGGEKIPPVTGGTPYIALAKGDGSVGYLNPATGELWTFNSASAKARVTIADGIEDRAQLSTPLDGRAIWFANQAGQLAFVRMADGQVSVFPSLYLNQAGDIWNVSVAPDSSYVALVSANRTDRSLYVLDLQTGWLGRIVLEPETTQDGIKDTSILYPDVVAWSPNMGLPKIGFDALHQVQVANTTVQYWGVAEINFTVGRMYDLVPGTTTSAAVGNIAYSNTDPNTLAMNRFDTVAGITLMDVALYRGGRTENLGISNFIVNGAFINDPMRPTFSPDDTVVAFSAPSLKLLGLYTLATKNLDGWLTPDPVYNPRWFVVGGVVPLTLADASQAMAIASGLRTASADDVARLNLVSSGNPAASVRLDDAVTIARKVMGVQP